MFAILLNQRSHEWSLVDGHLSEDAKGIPYYHLQFERTSQLPSVGFIVKLQTHEMKRDFRISFEAETNWLYSSEE
jgi:hypothetical protein